MRDYRDRSKDRLEKEISKLIKDLYVSCLDRAEKILRPDKRQDYWRQFRFEILNLGYDQIRQLGDRLDDYEVVFRPEIVFGVKYIRDNERSVIEEQVSKFDFYFYENQPGIRIEIARSSVNKQLLTTVWEAVRCGVVVDTEEKATIWWEAYGLAEIFSQVIPFFDNNKCFKGQALEDYNDWKEQVYKAEAQGAGKC